MTKRAGHGEHMKDPVNPKFQRPKPKVAKVKRRKKLGDLRDDPQSDDIDRHDDNLE